MSGAALQDHLNRLADNPAKFEAFLADMA